MSGEADVILVPRADLEAMRKAAKQMQETLEKAAEQAANDVENELESGVSEGIKKGSNNGFDGFSLKAKAAIASFALAAGGIIKDSLEQTLGGADEYVAKVAERAHGIREMLSGFKLFGVDDTQFAALSIASRSQGIEQDDLRGVFEGFASALDSPEMKAYKDISDKQGMDQAFFNLLMTAANKSPGEAQTWLATTAQMGDSDASFVNKLASVLRDMKSDGIEINRENFYDRAAGFDINTKELGHALNNSKPNIIKMRIDDTQREYERILRGVTREQANASDSRLDSQQRLENAHIANLTLKVKTANFQDNVTIAQMQATVKTLNALSKGKDKLESASENYGTEGNAAHQIPKELAQLGRLDMGAIGKQFKADMSSLAKWLFILNTDAMEKDVRKFFGFDTNTPSKDHIAQTGHAYESSDDK